MSFVLQSFSRVQVAIFLFTKCICTGILAAWQFVIGYGLVSSSSLKMHCFLSIYLRGAAVLTCIIGTQVLLLCCWPSSWVLLPTQSKLIGCHSLTWKPVSSIFERLEINILLSGYSFFPPTSSLRICNRIFFFFTFPDAWQPWQVPPV